MHFPVSKKLVSKIFHPSHLDVSIDTSKMEAEEFGKTVIVMMDSII